MANPEQLKQKLTTEPGKIPPFEALYQNPEFVKNYGLAMKGPQQLIS